MEVTKQQLQEEKNTWRDRCNMLEAFNKDLLMVIEGNYTKSKKIEFDQEKGENKKMENINIIWYCYGIMSGVIVMMIIFRNKLFDNEKK